jgi:hypothetical protein
MLDSQRYTSNEKGNSQKKKEEQDAACVLDIAGLNGRIEAKGERLAGKKQSGVAPIQIDGPRTADPSPLANKNAIISNNAMIL